MGTVRANRRADDLSVRRVAVIGIASVSVVGALSAGGFGHRAGAQTDPDPGLSTTTSSPSASSTITSEPSAPGGPPSTSPQDPSSTSTTSTTSITSTSLPPLALEAGAENGGIGQGAFDAASRAVLLSALRDANARLRRLERAVGDELRIQAPLRAEMDRLSMGGGDLERTEATHAAEVAAAREDLRQQAVSAFVRSDRRLSLLATWRDAESVSRGEAYLAALRTNRRAALVELSARSKGLSAIGTRLADRLAPLETGIADSDRRLGFLQLAVAHGQQEVAAYAAGSHVFVPGFRLPVLGPVSFIDSWGYPRMPGTPSAHWHEGTDIMAPTGRELVAVENGIMGEVGEVGLGGQRVWLHGDSGTSYYYAHLSAYGPGIAEGTPVSAGQVIGYVGTTGNASGGAAHLHFEIHPAGGPAVNPYPLLITTWGAAPMPVEADALAGPPALLPPGTAFTPATG